MFEFLKTPPPRSEPRAQSGARTVEERRAVLAEIAAEDAAWAENAARLAARIADTQDRVGRAEAMLAQARALRDELEAERLARSLGREQRISRLTHRLQLGAAPVVESFLRALGEAEDQMRLAFEVHTSYGHPDLITQHRPMLVATNNAGEVVAAIRAIRPQAEALRLVALPEDEIAGRLQALAGQLPELDPSFDLDLTAAYGFTRAELREAAWRAETPRETGRPWR